MGRHLALVPPLSPAPPPQSVAEVIGAVARVLDRRGLRLEIGIEGTGGVELDIDAASTTFDAFRVRAAAYSPLSVAGHPFEFGLSAMIPRAEFLTTDGFEQAQAEAVLKLMEKLRPHPAEFEIPRSQP